MPVRVHVAVVALHELFDDVRPKIHEEESRRFIAELAENRDLVLHTEGTIESRLHGADALVLISVHGSRQDNFLNPWVAGFDRMRLLPDHVFLLGWQEMNRLAQSISAFLQMQTRVNVRVLQEPYPAHLCRILHEQGVFRAAAIASGPW